MRTRAQGFALKVKEQVARRRPDGATNLQHPDSASTPDVPICALWMSASGDVRCSLAPLGATGRRFLVGGQSKSRVLDVAEGHAADGGWGSWSAAGSTASRVRRAGF